jgi:predicted phosphodiesterase
MTTPIWESDLARLLQAGVKVPQAWAIIAADHPDTGIHAVLRAQTRLRREGVLGQPSPVADRPTPAPVVLPEPAPPDRQTAVLVMTDQHYGKRTASYSTDVFDRRMQALGDRLRAIRLSMPDIDYDGLVVCLLGDVNDGSDIYPTQTHHQELTNPEAQADRLSACLEPWLLDQRGVWGEVRVECVPGNHGRTGKTAHEAANWDIAAYRNLRLRLRDKIAVHWTEQGDPFFRKVPVYGHTLLLYHGHDIPGGGTVPVNGVANRVLRWATSRLAPFDMVLMGHFHTSATASINSVDLLLSGTMVSDDDWALRKYGWESVNRWWMFGMSERKKLVWQYGLDLA